MTGNYLLDGLSLIGILLLSCLGLMLLGFVLYVLTKLYSYAYHRGKYLAERGNDLKEN